MNTIRNKVLINMGIFTFTADISVSPEVVPIHGEKLFYIDEYSHSLFGLRDGATIPHYYCQASPHWSPI